MLLSGCWDAIKIEQRSLIAVLGIDYLEDAPHYLITIVYPIVDPARTQESRVQTARATSLAEGYAILNHATRGMVSFGKLLMTVFGEDAAKHGVAGLINDLYKHPDIRTNSHIIVAKGRAVDLLSTVPPDGQRIGFYLRDLLHWSNIYGDIPAVPLFRLASTMMTCGMDTQTTLVGPIGALEPRPQDQRGAGSASGSEGGQNMQNRQESTDKEDVQILGAALWYGDKIVGEINLSEAQYLSLVKGNPRYMPMQLLFTDASDFAPVANRLMVYIEQSKTQWQLTLENNVPKYKAKIDIRVTLYNYQGRPNITESDNAKALEEILAATFRTNILSVLQKVSAMGSDPVYLGQKFRLKYPQQWVPEEWYDRLKQAEFNVDCDVTIRLTGYQTERMQPKSGGPN